MTQPLILKCGSKQTCMNLPNREELSLRTVLALPNHQISVNDSFEVVKSRDSLPNASSTVLASMI